MEPTRSGDGADGGDGVAAPRQPLGEALAGLSMYQLPEGHTALVAYALIRAQTADGELVWVGRTTDESLNQDELLGALVAHRDHVRDELSDWDDEEEGGEDAGEHELLPVSEALRGLDVAPLPEGWRATEAMVLVKMMGCDTGICWDHRYTAAVNWEELLGVLSRAIHTLTERPAPLRFE